MSTFLIILLSVIAFLALVVGGLLFLFFYQGGCCVRHTRQKISRKSYVQPAMKGTAGQPNA